MPWATPGRQPVFAPFPVILRGTYTSARRRDVAPALGRLHLKSCRLCGVQYVATVLAVGTECDIACLTVADDEFWVGTEAVTFGTLPHLQDSILVIG